MSWFWVGVVLLTLLILIFIPEIVAEPNVFIVILWFLSIIFALVLLIVLVRAIIYGVLHIRKVPTVEEQPYPETHYATEYAAKPVQTYRGLFGSLKEKLRDKTRDKLCTGLRTIGIDARLAERGLREECAYGDSRGKSMGLIEILGSPICWVNVLKAKALRGPYIYTNVYLIPNPSISTSRRLKTKSVRVKSTPLVGEVIDLKWEGFLGGDLIRLMNENELIKQTLIRHKEDIEIVSCQVGGYWVIASKRYEDHWSDNAKRQLPSQEQWDCYETIARHLLESSGK